jgi:hypothetical protein
MVMNGTIPNPILKKNLRFPRFWFPLKVQFKQPLLRQSVLFLTGKKKGKNRK